MENLSAAKIMQQRGMLAGVDVNYRDAGAVAACVCFQAWDDGTAALESVVKVDHVEPYQSGQSLLKRVVQLSRSHPVK